MSARRAIIPIFVPHLGCPHMCVFCDQRAITGVRTPVTAETVTRGIEDGLRRCGRGAELAFYGGSFTAIPTGRQEELLSAVLPFLQSGDIASIRLSTRPDAVDDETIDRLIAYGVKTVELGVQSMDDEVLMLSGRGHTSKQAEDAARLIKSSGLSLILQMMTGLPGATRQRDIATAKRLIALCPDGARVYPTVIVRGTRLHDMWLSGEYREHTVEDAVSLCAEIAELFDDAGIPIIRLGLNPTEDLSNGEAVAGAYHPALGELVLSRRFLTRMEALMTEDDRGRDVMFYVPKGRISAAVGQKRCNVRALSERYGVRSTRFMGSEELTGVAVAR